jgi:hypothetical protein
MSRSYTPSLCLRTCIVCTCSSWQKTLHYFKPTTEIKRFQHTAFPVTRVFFGILDQFLNKGHTDYRTTKHLSKHFFYSARVIPLMVKYLRYGPSLCR